ncbi:MAG: amino acid adenylation domain-containing protein [Clostridia bacterium]|nr:amino acid adenylation domain-containing protein [Clostridia bacterium]
MTEKSFAENPFGNGYIYRTGDSGKYLENGEIQYVDRLDNQVKIRGLRVELGEIENKILEMPFINHCAVIKKGNNFSHEYLCAYFTASQTINVLDIRKYLEKSLPQYMIPNYFMQLEKLPYTTNGKIDRKNLPEIHIENKVASQILMPRNSIDEQLIAMLQEILKINHISIGDSFFELGGDSLSAITLSLKIKDTFHCQITVKDILENPSIQKISDFVAEHSGDDTKIYNINSAKEAVLYPASSAQKRIYYTSQYAENSPLLYNSSGCMLFSTNQIDIQKLERCLQTLINRHESLRTCFLIKNNSLKQKIISKVDFHLDILENVPYENLEQFIKGLIQPFDLEVAPLFRAKFIYFNNQKSALFIDTHHIIFDGTSMEIFLDELDKLYHDKELPALQFSYKDFSSFENEQLSSSQLDNAANFWINQFQGEIPILDLPTTFPRGNIQDFEGTKLYSYLDEKITKEIYQLSSKLQITPYIFLLSCYYILLSKYTSNTDIVIGSPIIGREQEETYGLIGMFVNTLALRNKIDSEKTFQEFLFQIKANLLNCYQYQTYPFDELVKKLNIKKDSSRNPLFDTMFIYQNNGFPKISLDGEPAQLYIPDTNISKFDLSVEALPENDKIKLTFEYATKLFSHDFIAQFSRHYIHVINELIHNLNIKIKDISPLTTSERSHILNGFNETSCKYEEKTISTLFEEQVEKTPNHIALIFEKQKMTYRELNEKANSLAFHLRNNLKIKPNDLVGIMMNRSLEMIISILAVIKSGGTYIPIDPTFPKDRVNYMLESSNAKVLLTKENLKETIHFKETVYVDLGNSIYHFPNKNLTNNNHLDDLLYVIFTSGSTGRPKGVKIPHRTLSNFANYCNRHIEYLQNPENNTLVSIATVSFDIFTFETLISFQKGITVVLANEDEQITPSLLNTLMENNQVNCIQATPSIMQIFVNHQNIMPSLKNLQYISLTGEASSLHLVQELRKITNCTIYNGYGPSETYYVTLYPIDDDLVTIGKPFDNTQIYILDKNQHPVPISVVGEIYISGDGIGKGYLNHPELTKESYIPNPFIPGKLMYKSGDLGKYLPDGRIICLGRSDHQIKIRGLRIELEEIESLILKYPDIKNAVVVKQNIKDREFISAYFVSTKRISTNELRKYLSQFLPRYMVPSYYVALDELPYTPNGKVDKKALSLPESAQNIEKVKYVAPKTDLQKRLVKIWEQLLNIEPIGIHDNFFELGGDSILAMNLNIELLKITTKITYSEIFRLPTIAELEEKIIQESQEENLFFKKIENLSDNYVDILKNNRQKEPFQPYHPRGILLTGATGFLGIHLLEEFIKNETCNIYCLVRTETGISSDEKLEQKLKFYFGDKYLKYINQRIFCVTGDITKTNFGLSTNNASELANAIDIVVNSAANVAHFGDFKKSYETNVISVKHMIAFCKKFDKKLYHISTTGVCGTAIDSSYLNPIRRFHKKPKDIIFTESSLYIGQTLDGIYDRTKFEAEHYILNAISQGLDAYIFRMGQLMPRLTDGIFQENFRSNAYINRFVAICKIGVIPDYVLKRPLEFTPVDCAANAIYKILTNSTKTNRIFHLYNYKMISFKKFLKILKENGLNIRVTSEEQFKEKINQLVNDENFKHSLKNLVNDFDKNLHLSYNVGIDLNSDFSIRYLKRANFRWPKLYKRYFLKIIELLRRVM